MRTKTRVLSLAGLLVGAVVFGMIVAGSLDLTKWASAGPEPASQAVSSAAGAPPQRAQSALVVPNFADIAERLMPAIVSVTSTDIVKADKRRAPFHNFGGGEDGNPFDWFFGQPNPDRRRPRGGGEEDGDDQQNDEDQPQRSGGTGFIVRADGLIVTNNHVIEGADKVEVKVGDRDDYRAKVIGRDPATDLALIKIESKEAFPTVPLGDSDRLRVGEWVMAIGDPLQFEKTVTVGVVSGKGRVAGLSRATSAFENLIQTDAAINFGNSGGPLVNLQGEVIGINTAISRFAQNIGFAVPINTFKRLQPQLEKGKVVRGFLGVQITSVDRKLMESMELKDANGAVVQSVEKGNPGDKAGLKHEDVITQVDNQKIKNNRELIDYISSRPPGAKVQIVYIREGKEHTTTATLGTREDETEKSESGDEENGKTTKEKIGISVSDLTAAARRSYRINDDAEKGVVITHVKPVSTSADAGLLEGDVILEVNGVEVGSVDQFRTEMKKREKAKSHYVRLYVLRSVPRVQKFIAAVKLED